MTRLTRLTLVLTSLIAFGSAVLLLMAACTSTTTPPSTGYGSVQDADAKTVESCRFVAHVSGGSLIGGLAQRTGRERARNDARKQAAALGATHVVWSIVQSTNQGSAAEGDAYACPK